MRVLKAKHFERLNYKPAFTRDAIKLNLPGAKFDYIADQAAIYYYDRTAGAWFRAFQDFAEEEGS